MCLCVHISNGTNCIKSGICIILICAVSLGALLFRANTQTAQCILLAGRIVTLIAALFLLLGAVMELASLVWVWIAASIIGILLAVTGSALVIHNNWDDQTHFLNAMDIAFLILFTTNVLCAIFVSILFLRDLSDKERESRLQGYYGEPNAGNRN